jgi:hypothetical protein
MLALMAPGLWWRLLVFFSSPHRIGPDRQTGLILGSVAGAAVFNARMTSNQPWWLTMQRAKKAPRRQPMDAP